MNDISRRKLMRAGVVALPGALGLAAAARIAERNGLVPPDHSGLYGPGETLTYAAQRVLTAHSLAREFDRSQISKKPFANETPKKTPEFLRLEAAGFVDWRLKVDGMVARPAEFSVAQIRSFPAHSQITHLACEEGWSYVAEWTGALLSDVLHEVGMRPEAKFVVYDCMDKGWWESIDMADALHPQTFVAYGFNGGELPVAFGGPLRMRVPRQLGYKSLKYITRLTVTDSLKKFGKGLGSAEPESGYAWYAGI